MPSDCKQVVVLYAEAKLQKSIDLPGSFTVKAKEEGIAAIRDHLQTLPGVPPVTFDPGCTDFYPATKDNTIICSLKDNLTMVVYPEPPQGQRFAPSPVVNALQSAIHEVCDLKAQENAASLIREESTESNVKPSYPDNDVLHKFEAMEERFGHDIAELRRENAELRQENAELRDQMNETTRAVLGDRIAIDRVRQRVPLDIGRDQLAIMRNGMTTEARTMLQGSEDATRADIAAHSSTETDIAESVLALTSEGDKNGMITIYRAVYNSEPSYV
ncbi:hypothetical protein DFH29DRAFT_1000640 [Suillus ampliporus]|nr:hypothetical protein DFH29DRAFT_1000640 [Suillus ampliporus]